MMLLPQLARLGRMTHTKSPIWLWLDKGGRRYGSPSMKCRGSFRYGNVIVTSNPWPERKCVAACI